MREYTEQLVIESIGIGAAMIPVSYLLNSALGRLPISNSIKVPALVALSSALFHLGAEFSGFNAWYVENGACSKKGLHDWMTTAAQPPPKKSGMSP